MIGHELNPKAITGFSFYMRMHVCVWGGLCVQIFSPDSRFSLYHYARVKQIDCRLSYLHYDGPSALEISLPEISGEPVIICCYTCYFPDNILCSNHAGGSVHQL